MTSQKEAREQQQREIANDALIQDLRKTAATRQKKDGGGSGDSGYSGVVYDSHGIPVISPIIGKINGSINGTFGSTF
jgi:hypothetical protein